MKTAILIVLSVIAVLVSVQYISLFVEKHMLHLRGPIIKLFDEIVGIESWKISSSGIVDTFGEPDSVEYKETSDGKIRKLVHYPGLTFGFWQLGQSEIERIENFDGDEWMLYMTDCYDPKYDFGKGIHVGCSKRHIRLVCPKRLKVAEAEIGMEYFNRKYIDIIQFEYDSNDKVTHIIHYG